MTAAEIREKVRKNSSVKLEKQLKDTSNVAAT